VASVLVPPARGTPARPTPCVLSEPARVHRRAKCSAARARTPARSSTALPRHHAPSPSSTGVGNGCLRPPLHPFPTPCPARSRWAAAYAYRRSVARQGLEKNPSLDEEGLVGHEVAKAFCPRHRLRPVVVQGRLFLGSEGSFDRELIRAITVGEQPSALVAGRDTALIRMPCGEVLGERGHVRAADRDGLHETHGI